MTAARVDDLIRSLEDLVVDAPRIWIRRGTHGVRLVTDPELEYEVDAAGDYFEVVRFDRGNPSAVFRSSDGRAVVAYLIGAVQSAGRIRGCVYLRPPGFEIVSSADGTAEFRWGAGDWAVVLDGDFSLANGLAWAWTYAAADDRLASWVRDPRRGRLWGDESEQCATPPLFRCRLTVAKWEDWLASSPPFEGARS